MRNLLQTASLVTLTSLAACSSVTSPPPALLVEVRLDRTPVEPGGELQVGMVARNASRSSIVLERARCTPLEFEVRRSDGTFVGPAGSRTCAFLGDPPQVRLAPGDSLAVRHRWSAVWGYPAGDTTGGRHLSTRAPEAGTPLEPGLYTVRALLLDAGGEWRPVGRTTTLEVRVPR
jgi:hypothetical protein